MTRGGAQPANAAGCGVRAPADNLQTYAGRAFGALALQARANQRGSRPSGGGLEAAPPQPELNPSHFNSWESWLAWRRCGGFRCAPTHEFSLTRTKSERSVPANRKLPMLPLELEDGFFVASSDYLEPVGPTYWERPDEVNPQEKP